MLSIKLFKWLKCYYYLIGKQYKIPEIFSQSPTFPNFPLFTKNSDISWYSRLSRQVDTLLKFVSCSVYNTVTDQNPDGLVSR